MVHKRRIGNPGHPFLQQLRERYDTYGSVQDQRHAERERQLEGQRQVHTPALRKRVTPKIFQDIMTGSTVPNMEQVAQLVEDSGLSRGQEGYTALIDLGEKYYEHYHPDKKKQDAQKEKPTEAKNSAEDSAPTTLGDVFKRIRKARYYFPFDQHSAQPFISKKEWEILSQRQKKNAKPLSVLNIINSFDSGWSDKECNRRLPTADDIYDIKIAFRCTPEECALLDSFSCRESNPPIALSLAEAFKRFRLKLDMGADEMADALGYKTPMSVYYIENGNCTLQNFKQVIAKSGFESPEAFLEAEASLPETDALRRGKVLNYRSREGGDYAGRKVDPLHANTLRRYRLKLGKSQEEMGHSFSLPSGLISTMEKGRNSQRLFNRYISALGFSPEALIEAEAQLPESAASRVFDKFMSLVQHSLPQIQR